MRGLIVGLLMSGLSGAALAGDGVPVPLPSLALDPPMTDSIWHGFYVGTDIVGVARKGSKGVVGGDVTAGYDRVFANGFVLGMSGATGVAPGLWGLGPIQTYDFATLGTRVAYPMGRWTPYVTGDLILAKPNSRLGGAFSGMDTANDLFNSPEKLGVGGKIGAGFDYALTNAVTVGLGVSIRRGADAVFP